MSDPRTLPPENGLRAEITDALVTIWTRYAGKRPAAARTELRDDVVTCVLVDAVSDYDASQIASGMREGVAGVGRHAHAAVDYKADAVATVARLTGRRVIAFISSHDPDTDVATETFRLERRLFA